MISIPLKPNPPIRGECKVLYTSFIIKERIKRVEEVVLKRKVRDFTLKNIEEVNLEGVNNFHAVEYLLPTMRLMLAII